MDDNASICLDQASLASLEPIFFQYQGWLAEPPVEANERLLEHLAHRVSRNPADLLSHVQRVMLCARLHLCDEVYGALLDLFIALGDKGHALRVRLLAQCRGMLSAQQLGVLEPAVLSGISAMDVVPLVGHSRLSAGVSGSVDIVSMIDANQPTSATSVIDEARDLLDSGHIEMACDLLEPALLASPQNLEISQELLTIYHHTRDLTRLKRMLEQLTSTLFSMREEWQALATRLATGDEHG